MIPWKLILFAIGIGILCSLVIKGMVRLTHEELKCELKRNNMEKK